MVNTDKLNAGASKIKDTVQVWANSPSPKVFYDRGLIWIAFGLMLVGLVMVTSASFSVGSHLFDNPFHFITRHVIFLCLAVLAAMVVINIPVEKWMQYSVYLLLISVFLLSVVILGLGKSVNGASRWIPIGPFNIQPAEIAKLSLFIFMSSYLSRKHEEVRDSFFGGFIKPIIVFSLLAFLLLLQPDLGTVVVMLVTLFAMLFIAGAKLFQFLSLLVSGVGIVALLIMGEEYRMRRMTSFMRPFDDPFGAGYQLVQSLIAFGRGDWFGQGLGNSIQKLKYLPEAHTDFVFAVVAEELGFTGVVLILILIFSLVYKALNIGRKSMEAGNIFAGFLSISISVWFAFQTLVNVGAASGIVPTKGLTLPLISYGGSSLIVMSVSVAILIRIDYEYRINQWQLSKVDESENNQRSQQALKEQALKQQEEERQKKNSDVENINLESNHG